MIASKPFVLNHGIDSLRDPQRNKSTAFAEAEREELGLASLLPAGIDTQETQMWREPQQIGDKPTGLERYMCLKFGQIFPRPRGMYLSLKHKGRIREVLGNWPKKDVRVICVTLGEHILRLGDLGANSTGIPIGKPQLYAARAAVPPQYLLPIRMDFGTNKSEPLNDPQYLGMRKTRVSTAERLPKKYRDKVCCYNDDIQVTAAVALAGILSALRITGGKLSDQRILFLGADSAGIGIADLVASAMTLDGWTIDQARARISHFDINGLLEPSRTDLFDFQRPYAHPHAPSRDFVSVIEDLRPTAIIGVSTKGKTFTQNVIETMSRINQRPIIFAYSNPTEHAECTAEDAYRWSDGRALYAAGVQFQPVPYNGKTLVPRQGNNLYVLPAVGLAIYATQARRVTDEMFIAAARAVADQVSDDELRIGLLYPAQSNILETEITTAQRVAEVIFNRGLAGVRRPKDLRAFLESHLYRPEYSSAATAR